MRPLARPGWDWPPWDPAPRVALVQSSFDLNPFSATRLNPLRNEYLFSQPAESLAEIARRFCALRHRQAAIVGPHGTGKSTLAASLVPVLSQHFDAVVHRVCPADSASHCGAAQLVCGAKSTVPPAEPTLFVLDGFERLRWQQRCRVLWWARRHRVALLLTLHRPALLLPTLYRTAGSLETCQQVAQRHLEEFPEMAPPILEWLARRWPQYHGNTREALFAMYDAFEQLRRARGQFID